MNIIIQILLWIIADLIIGVFALKCTAKLLYGHFRIEISGFKEVLILISLSLVWPISTLVFIGCEIYNNRREIKKWFNEIYFKI